MSYVAGAIEVQMLADMARLRADMQEARRMVSDTVGSIEMRADKLRSVLGGLAGGLVAGASVLQVSRLVGNAIDAMDALNDLSTATSITVEDLSGLAEVGRYAGITLDDIAGISNRVAKTMATQNEESKGAAQALRLMNIQFEAFQRLGAAERLQALAKGFAGIADGPDKTAMAIAIMGKEGAKALPFMKDLAAQGELVATVTSEQARQAEVYSDNLEALRQQNDAWARQLAVGLLPELITMQGLAKDLAEVMGDYMADGAKRAAGGLDTMGIAIKALGVTMETLLVLGSNVAYVFNAIRNDLGGIAAQTVLVGKGDLAGALEVRRMMREDAAANRAALDEFERRIMGATDRALQARQVLQGNEVSRYDAARELARINSAAGRELRRPRFVDEAEKTNARLKEQERLLKEQQRIEQEIARAREATGRINAAALASLDQETHRMIDDNQALRDEIELLGLEGTARAAVERARISSARALLEERAAMAANAGASDQELRSLQQQIELLRQREALMLQRTDRENWVRASALDTTVPPGLGTNTYTEVRDALSAAFRDTKNPAKAFADALGNAVFTRVSAGLAEAMALQLVGASGSGGLFGTVLGGLRTFFGGGVPFGDGTGATGDFARFDRLATPLATGMDYVPYDGFRALLHRGEAVVPAAENAGGARRLHYAPTTHIHIDGQVDRASVRQEVAAIVEAGNRRHSEELRRLGVL